MKNVRLLHVCLFTLLSPILLVSTLGHASAQGRQPRLVPSTAQQHGAPVTDYHKPLPRSVVAKPMRPGTKTRAAVAQTADLTAGTPQVTDQHPFWAKDEQSIVFESNRGTNPAGAPISTFHVYRMTSDGAAVTALTGPQSSKSIGVNSSQTEPATNPGTSAVVYIDTTTSGAVDLMELNLVTSTARSILKANPQGFVFTALNHPEYGFAIGGSGVGVIFAGKRTNDTSFHLFTVDTATGNVAQLTSGGANDKNPTLCPDSARPVVLFDSDRTDASGTAGGATRQIWAIGNNPAINNATRVTNFSPGGAATENIEPAWSTNKVDQPNGSQHIVNGQQLIAFASTRYDSNNDGNANGVNPNGTHDIYWLKVTVAVDPNNPSVYTVTLPESQSNPALKLVSSDKDHIYDDRHPTWPQFISTYRVAYDSDRSQYIAGTNSSGPAGQPRDIFASTLIDLNAPTLVRFDDVTGDVVSVSPRFAAPGQQITFKVKLQDLETGVRDVWIQIKNPNSKYQSADGREHKVYLFTGLALDNTTSAINVPVEYESQRIYVGNNPNDPQVNSYADPVYTASLDDFFAFSGEAAPPEAGWLQLQPDGAGPDSNGTVTYVGTWTAAPFPSDYYIDVIAYDNSLNPFSTGPSDVGVNWKIYDNVWGFTTQSFVAAHGILFVSDYAAGQKFFGSRFGAQTLVNVVHTFWGSESWMTDIDVSLLPRSYISSNTVGSLVDVLNALGVKSYGAFDPSDPYTAENFDPIAVDGTKADNVDVPATQQYDIWRILSRGAVPDSVLSQYTPHHETQPPDSLAGEKNPRDVLVAPRCVIWHAPYTGNLFTGAGTLTDLAVQGQLHNFLTAGGRLFVNGQDIGWALTLDGSGSNAFFTNDLKANYVADSAGATFFLIPSGPRFRLGYGIAGNYALTLQGIYDPISHDPWEDPASSVPYTHHQYPGPPAPPETQDYPNAEQKFHVGGNSPTTPHTYGSPGAFYPDIITPIAPAISDARYANGQTLLQHYTDTSTNAKVVYCSSGIEGLFPDYFTPNGSTNTISLKNARSEILHNAVCWMRTGSITGKVLDLNGGAPVPGALVRMTNRSANGTPVTAYTAITGNDGSFAINGVEPAFYEITAFHAGFIISKRTEIETHGGFRNDISFRMTKAEPANVTGKVTRPDGTPQPGIVVQAVDNLNNNNVFTATTDLNGVYTIQKLPAGTTYQVSIPSTIPDPNNPGKTINQGTGSPAFIPLPNPNDPISGQRDQTVQPAKTYTGFDFTLKPVPGTLTGTVIDAATNNPISGATVTVTAGKNTFTGTTDANGVYTITGIDPGSVTVTATAPGYRPSAGVTASVTSGSGSNGQPADVAPTISMTAAQPGSISGLITRTSDGQPQSGVTVTLKDANGATVATTTTTAVQTVGGYSFNYKFNVVQSGSTYTVVPTMTGFTAVPISKTATVTENTETKNVNFQMDPLHTFPGLLTLVSAPFDYTGYDAATLLSANPQDPSFIFTTWDLGRYINYPQAPADTFHIGRGYFLQYKNNLPLSTMGTAADPTQPFNLPLNPGWNLIGDPFYQDAQGNNIDIDWTKVAVDYLDGQPARSHDQAIRDAKIGPTLYSYISGGYVLDFKMSPWKGYFVRAFANVRLVIDPINDRYGRAARVPANSRAVLSGGDGWSVNLRLNAGTLSDADNYFGVTTRAVDGFDGYKGQKPPVFGKDYAYLSFDHDTWGDKSGGYGVDIRSAAPGQKSWEFTVQTTAPNTPATLTWPNVATINKNAQLTITDLVSGKTQDMRTSGFYSWQTGDAAASRKFRIDLVQATQNGTIRITGINAQVPNGGRAAGVNISYTLSTPASIEMRILGTGGNVVRKLGGRATRAAGVNQAVWDQRNDQGVAMPAGAYLIEIRAQTTDGKQTVRATQPLLVVR